MKIPFLGRSAVALALGVLLAGCDGDGNDAVNVFFGFNADGDCDRVEVEIDLEAADAELARLDDGAVDCVIAELTEQQGCEAEFEELDGGDRLKVTISDCDLSGFNVLFECGFEEADLSELSAVTLASCDCEDDGCDMGPPVCIGTDTDLDLCEDCTDDIDNDGDGDIDCDDTNCFRSTRCDPTATTMTTTTTTLDEPTTTTMPQVLCELVFRLDDDVTAGSLQWTTDYSLTDSEIPGSGPGVECESLVEGALAAFHDAEDVEELESGLVSLDGIDGPVDVSRCTFVGPEVPSLDDIVISGIEAATPDLVVISPDPSVSVQLNCDGVTTTSTTVTTITSTTDQPTTTTTIPSGDTFNVLFKLDASSAPLGALQFGVDYGSATGEFQGSGSAVACTNKVVGALFAPNDEDGLNKLTLGIIALSGFSAPTDLVQCTFAGTDPTAGDFVVTIEDATDADGVAATATISVVVTAAP